MNYALHKLGGADVGVVVMLALYALFGQRDGLLRAVLQTAEALDAICAEGWLSVNKAYVALWTELFTLAAAMHASVTANFLALPTASLGQTLLSSALSPILGGAFLLFSPARMDLTSFFAVRSLRF